MCRRGLAHSALGDKTGQKVASFELGGFIKLGSFNGLWEPMPPPLVLNMCSEATPQEDAIASRALIALDTDGATVVRARLWFKLELQSRLRGGISCAYRPRRRLAADELESFDRDEQHSAGLCPRLILSGAH